MKNKIYLSGAISNNKNHKRDFKRAEEFFKKKGFRVLNPIKTSAYKNKKSSGVCMFNALSLLKNADFIVFITKGIKSNGVKIERLLAKYCGIKEICLTKKEKEELWHT